MSKYIGRRINVGVARETSRGTYVAPTYWMPKVNVDFDDKADKVVTAENLGAIDDASEAYVTKLFAQGSIDGEVRDRSFGLILYALLGAVSSAQTDGAAYTHTFSLSNTNQHQSLSLTLADPDQSLGYTLSMLNKLEINIELGQYVLFKAEFLAKAGDGLTAATASYVVENKFVARMANLKVAAALANLDAATATSVKSVKITFTKNVVSDDALGTIEPEDYLNRHFSVEGEVMLNYVDTTFKAYMTANTYRALRIQCIDSNTTIGGSSNPTLQINLPRVHFFDWKPENANDEIRKQTISFKGLKDLSGSNSLVSSIVLINTATSY